jgi:hypothetical protein
MVLSEQRTQMLLGWFVNSSETHTRMIKIKRTNRFYDAL